MDKFIFYAANILVKSFLTLAEILPYLIAGTAIGEALRYVSLHKYMKKFPAKSSIVSILAASLLGMVSPLCTYGTVPVAISFTKSGMPAAVLIVFLISSSMMNPQLFIITWGGIGKEMALMRVLTIALFALFMGFVLKIIPEKYILNINNVQKHSGKNTEPAAEKENFTWKGYILHVLKSLEYVGFYIVTGVILASAIEVLLPGDIASKLQQQNKMLQVLAMSFISIPFYSCGGGVIPIVNAFIAEGMSNGAALAFLNVGAATRITVLAAMASMVRPLFIFIYIIILVLFSILLGYLYI